MVVVGFRFDRTVSVFKRLVNDTASKCVYSWHSAYDDFSACNVLLGMGDASLYILGMHR